VLAGQRGWRSDGVFAEMRADTAMWGRYIHYVEAPTDAELAHLYGNCAFTVFPSLHEGWGLPITESLDFAKPCIAADNSALPEAGQGLALHLDAHDLDGWVAAAQRLIESPHERAAIASRIRAAYRRRTWRQVGDEIHAVAAAIADRAGHAHPATPPLPPSKFDSPVASD
jgi:glycosyltransferase involved in cell wall biosynthesis